MILAQTPSIVSRHGLGVILTYQRLARQVVRCARAGLAGRVMIVAHGDGEETIIAGVPDRR